MKPKSQQEQSAAERQVGLLTNALEVAKLSEGYWMNPSGKYYPRFYPKGPEVSPFNAIMLTLFADTNGYKTPLYTTFPDAKIRNEGVWLVRICESGKEIEVYEDEFETAWFSFYS